MAAFSYQNQTFLLDSVFFPKIPGFSEEPNTNTTTPTSCFSQFYPSEPLHEIPITNNELSVTVKYSTDQYSSLSVVDKIDSGEQVTQKITSMVKKRNNIDGSSSNSSQSKDIKKVKGKKKKRSNGDAEKKGQKKVVEEAPKGYIHVRARRGQATDSHSLAERVRRMKISERMKVLQTLVPGCDKVTGKALMLDEIINYVQSLQNQVEFLSMKLASVNPEFYDFGVDLDAFMIKPEKLSNLASPIPNVEQCSAFTTVSNHSLLDSSSSFLLQQGQKPHLLSQDNGRLLWDLDDQRQKLINQTGLISNNLCAYN